VIKTSKAAIASIKSLVSAVGFPVVEFQTSKLLQ
jgi:hypothetical protein